MVKMLVPGAGCLMAAAVTLAVASSPASGRSYRGRLQVNSKLWLHLAISKSKH